MAAPIPGVQKFPFTVMVVEGKALPIGKHFCEIGIKGQDIPFFKTEKLKKTATPLWNANFQLNSDRPETDILEVKICDKKLLQTLTGSEAVIAMTELPFWQTLRAAPGNQVDGWWELFHTDAAGKREPRGSIHLKLWSGHSASGVAPGVGQQQGIQQGLQQPGLQQQQFQQQPQYGVQQPQFGTQQQPQQFSSVQQPGLQQPQQFGLPQEQPFMGQQQPQQFGGTGFTQQQGIPHQPQY